MRNGELEREVLRFDPEIPIDEAATPPSSWYTRPEFLELEKETVFRNSWQYACPKDKLAAPGDYVRVDVLGDSYMVVLDAEGALRGFHNVCSHHASQLVEARGAPNGSSVRITGGRTSSTAASPAPRRWER